jgi:hypothetical protein
MQCEDLGAVSLQSSVVGGSAMFEIDLSGLDLQGVMRVEENQDAQPQAATARWVNGWLWDGWVCDLEILDYQACIGLCGGTHNIESITTSPNPPNSPMGSQPDCDVSCSCGDGSSHDWLNDPPITVVAP